MDTNHSAMAIVIEHYAETNGIDRFYSLPDHSVHAGPSTPDFKDFEPVPTSICGGSKPRSDTVASGTKVRERKCFCGLPSVVGRNREDRAFINCAAGSCKFSVGRIAFSILHSIILRTPASIGVCCRALFSPFTRKIGPNYRSILSRDH